MELGWSNETWFMDITSPDLLGLEKNVSRIINEDFLTFSITEEMAKCTTGTLSVNDNHNFYSRVFRNGMKLKISFGYKKNDLLLGLLLKTWRDNMTAIVSTPSGGGAENGLSTYNITFYSDDVLQRKQKKTFDFGVRFSVLSALFQDLGIFAPLIDYNDSSVAISKKAPVIQWESSFKMLNRLAKEWHCHFQVGYNQAGVKTGMFIDEYKIGTTGFVYNSAMTFNPLPKELYYNAGSNSNVKSYSWQQHIGESGQGDNVQIRIGVDGKPIFERRVAKGQTVMTYQLNPQKIAAAYANAKDLTKKTDLFTEFLNARDFEEVKWAFDAVESSTAPQGAGFTVNVEMIGDPNIVPGQQVKFKDGFPSILSQSESPLSPIIYYVLKVTNTMSQRQYTTSLEIVDSYTLNGGFLQDTRELP